MWGKSNTFFFFFFYIKSSSLARCLLLPGLQPFWFISRFLTPRKRTQHRNYSFLPSLQSPGSHFSNTPQTFRAPLSHCRSSYISWWKKKVSNLSLYHFPSPACHTCEIMRSFSWHREDREIKWKDTNGWRKRDDLRIFLYQQWEKGSKVFFLYFLQKPNI